MFKLCISALLFYNIAITSGIPLENDANAYKDDATEAKFNFLKLFETFNAKARENTRDVTESSLENWTGPWMPERSGDPAPPPTVQPATQTTHKKTTRISMGSRKGCDSGKTNLTRDWDNSPVNYTCYSPKIEPDIKIDSLLYSESIPIGYIADHKCMDVSIEYEDIVPLYGNHRPVWPVYGEYKFIPRQRWLHSLEHGAVVMLYHPCASPSEIGRLKSLVKGCLRRYIISPYNLLDVDRPLVLVAWGFRLSMSYVNPKTVKEFIITKALRGPEKIPNDGGFKEGLLIRSERVVNFDDTTLCP